MKVEVRYWAQLRSAAGRASEEVELEQARTVRGLVALVAERHGEPLRSHLLDEAGRVRANLLLVLGDRQVPHDDPVELAGGDVVTIMPPISGG